VNKKSKKLVSTDREHVNHLQLKDKYSKVDLAEFELCLLDTNLAFDDFWLSHYK